MVVGSFTVRAVVFTVVIGCSGVCHYQQLLDVTLEEKKKWKSSMSAEATINFTPMGLELGSIFLHCKEVSVIIAVTQQKAVILLYICHYRLLLWSSAVFITT